MYVSLVKLVLIAGYCCSVRAVLKFFTSTCIFRNKAIMANSLWQQAGVLNNMACAVLCMMDCQCLTFSYSSSEEICRGYSNNGDYYRDMLKDGEGNTVFRTCRVKRPYGCSCNRSDECSVHGSVCYAGVCLCKPDLYFSPQQNVCVRECEEYGNGMDFYMGASIKGYNNKVLHNTTLSSCCNACVREKGFICLTGDWDSRDGQCNLSEDGYGDVPFDHRELGDVNWGLVQRRCK